MHCDILRAHLRGVKLSKYHTVDQNGLMKLVLTVLKVPSRFYSRKCTLLN